MEVYARTRRVGTRATVLQDTLACIVRPTQMSVLPIHVLMVACVAMVSIPTLATVPGATQAQLAL